MFVEFRSGIGRQSLADRPSQAEPGNEDQGQLVRSAHPTNYEISNVVGTLNQALKYRRVCTAHRLSW